MRAGAHTHAALCCKAPAAAPPLPGTPLSGNPTAAAAAASQRQAGAPRPAHIWAGAECGVHGAPRPCCCRRRCHHCRPALCPAAACTAGGPRPLLRVPLADRLGTCSRRACAQVFMAKLVEGRSWSATGCGRCSSSGSCRQGQPLQLACSGLVCGPGARSQSPHRQCRNPSLPHPPYLASCSAKLQLDFMAVQRRGWRLWPLASWINQQFVPLQARHRCWRPLRGQRVAVLTRHVPCLACLTCRRAPGRSAQHHFLNPGLPFPRSCVSSS